MTDDRPAASLIHLEGIEKYFGSYHALRGIDLDIREGEFFSLLGPSGCGKTTLLRTIAGFEDASAGTLTIDGADMRGVAPNRRPTNMVFQSYAIFPHLSVAQNVGFGLRRSGLDRAAQASKVAQALDMVGLGGYGDRAAHALSGGQRQRVALARALILEPRVLLLDEPLSALDKKLREGMQAELRRLQRQVGITFVLVTHDQEEALIMSDRIAVMFEGAIAQVAAPQDLYGRPVDRKVAEFIGMMTFLPGSVSGSEVDVAGLGRCTLDPGQAPGGLFDGAASVGIRPEPLSVLEEGEDAVRTAPGTVREVMYYGDMTYYEMTLEGSGHAVTISMKNVPGRPILSRGDPTRIGWDPRALVVFADKT